MSDEPDLVSLLYRADWTRLSLTAEVSTSLDLDLFHGQAEDEAPPGPPRWRPFGEPREPRPTGNEWEVATELQGIQSGRSTLLIAPGRRYREQSESFLSGCDGDRSWHAVRDDGGWTVDETGGPEPPLGELLRPSWMLSGYTLEPGERVTMGGRDALRAVATPRPGIWPRPMARRPLDRVEAVVDLELGILLRQEEFLDGRTLRVAELTDILIDPAPAADDVWCRPPGGWDSVDDSVPQATPNGPGWEVAKLAAGLAAGGIGALVRSSRFRPFEQATQEEAEAEMPQDLEPWPPDAPPVSDTVLHLLHASRGRWAPGITATMHQWHDIAAMLARIPDSARRTGFGGLGFLLDAAGERIATLHTVSRLSLGGSGQYVIEPVPAPGLGQPGQDRPGRHQPGTIVCDGERRWRIGDREVTAGPAGPPPRETANLFDTSWLLEHPLTGGAEIMAGGRRGYRVKVGPGDQPWSWFIFPGEVVVDAELSILLRWISFAGSQPVMRYELRDVMTGPLEPGEFQPDIPPGVHVVEEPNVPPGPVNPASVIARQAAKEARSAVRNFLGLIRGDDAR